MKQLTNWRKPSHCNPEETCPSQGSGRMERGKGGESGLVRRDTPIVMIKLTSRNSSKFYYDAFFRLHSDGINSIQKVKCSLPIKKLMLFKKEFKEIIL